MAEPSDLLSDSKIRAPFWRRHWAALLGGFVVLVALYYPIGMLMVHQIDDDTGYQAAAADLPPNGSRAVAIARALIDREVNQHHWVANDPFFYPGSALDNMPNFQQGMIAGLGRFAFELTDQIGRTRGSSQTDPDLQEAAGALQFSGTKWVFDFSTSLMPSATSQSQYRKAIHGLDSYNKRLSLGQAVFERRSDNLQATLDRIALDLGSASAALDHHISESSGRWIDFQADDVFYYVKGQTYAYFMVMRELQQDFAGVIKERELGAAWQQMLDSLRDAASLDPLFVMNSRPDGTLQNHLAVQGFYLLRARTQMREITNILLK